MSTLKVAIVIPALNEEAAIRQLLPEIPPGLATWTIVADNGSTDDTTAINSCIGSDFSSGDTHD